MDTGSVRKSTGSFLTYLLVAGVAFLVFLPWVQGYFLGDDWMLYARNCGHPLPDHLRVISVASNSSYYRPLYELLLSLLWSVFGFNPVGHHVVNLLLHALNTALVAVLGQRLSGDRRVSGLAGLVFAVLGCHTGAVVWMTARHTLVVATLALLSFLSYAKFRSSGRLVWWIGSLVLYVLSLGFKETALALPLFLAFYDLLFALPRNNERRHDRPTIKQAIPLLPSMLVGFAYTLFRLIVGGGYNVPLTLLGPPKNLVYYLLMEAIALPASTHFLSRFPLTTLPAIVSLASAIGLGVWLAGKRTLRNRVVWIGLLWMVCALGPVILMVAERTTYVSSIGWALAVPSIIILGWDASSQNRGRLRRGLISLVIVTILTTNLVTLTHRAYWWNHAASISRDLFSRVQTRMRSLPPESEGQLWFINLPNHIEYADAFGNRILFAVWLLQEQGNTSKLKPVLLDEPLDGLPPDEWAAQAVSEQALEGPVFAFYWQDGAIVELALHP